jgi:ELWxxDGT repeat protein
MGLLLGAAGKAEAVKLSRVTNFNSESGFGPQGLTVFDNALYFSAEDKVHGRELWKYDGTAASLVADIQLGSGSFYPLDGSSYPEDLTVFNNALYFSANDGVHGRELWKYDGTITSLVADINPDSSDSVPLNLTVFGNALYFSANNGVNSFELWKYDGTTASLVADINPGSTGSYPRSFTVFDNTLYFLVVPDGAPSEQIWKYDGTTLNKVTDITEIFDSFIVFNKTLYFVTSNAFGSGKVWKYDGTTFSEAPNVFPGLGPFSESSDFAVFNNALYSFLGDQLWRYDGTTSRPVAYGVSGEDLTVFDNVLYFRGGDFRGQELWQYDSTTISLVADIEPAVAPYGPLSSYPADFTLFDNALYFTASQYATGRQIWKLEPDEPTSVPEPASTFGLLAFGALGTGSMLKRKQKKQLNSAS